MWECYFEGEKCKTGASSWNAHVIGLSISTADSTPIISHTVRHIFLFPPVRALTPFSSLAPVAIGRNYKMFTEKHFRVIFMAHSRFVTIDGQLIFAIKNRIWVVVMELLHHWADGAQYKDLSDVQNIKPPLLFKQKLHVLWQNPLVFFFEFMRHWCFLRWKVLSTAVQLLHHSPFLEKYSQNEKLNFRSIKATWRFKCMV